MTINAAFGEAKGKPCQRLSLERILETRPAARESLQSFLICFSKANSGTNFELGPDKNLDVAENKAKRDYDGNMLRVTDYVRAKMSVDNVDAIRFFSSKEFKHMLYENDITLESSKNYFEDPKDQTGYRCINLKLNVPVGLDDKGYPERQIVELQVVADQIEAVYDQTHEYKRRAEEAGNTISALMVEHNIYPLKKKELANEALTREEDDTLKWFDSIIKPYKRIEKLNFAACMLINARASRSDDPKQNFESLILPHLKGKHYLYPGRESHLEDMKYKADQLNHFDT